MASRGSHRTARSAVSLIGCLAAAATGCSQGNLPAASGVRSPAALAATSPGAPVTGLGGATSPAGSVAARGGRSTSVEPRADMVLVPAGPFTMGNEAHALEAPKRSVYLKAYYIDRNLVSAAQYEAFARATGRHYEGQPKGASAQHPVVRVTLDDARAYAAYVGKRLPTEAEWEKAARGSDGRLWPWGNRFDPSRVTEPVIALPRLGAHPRGASPCGALDMVGTVFQWTEEALPQSSFEHYGFTGFGAPNQASDYYLVKGGCYLPYPGWTRASSFYPMLRTVASPLLGFRCAMDAPTRDADASTQPAPGVSPPAGSPSPATSWSGNRTQDAALIERLGRRPQTKIVQGRGLNVRGEESFEALRQVLTSGGAFDDSRTELAAQMVAFCQIRPGQHVADVGCGTGWFSFAFARAVGPRGRVYGVDIDLGVLDFVDEVARRWKVRNVKTVESVFNDVSLPAGSLDHAFLFPTYGYVISNHDPAFGETYERLARPFLQSLHRALKPGATMSIINTPTQIEPATIKAQAQANGFTLERENQVLIKSPDFDAPLTAGSAPMSDRMRRTFYGLIFRRR